MGHAGFCPSAVSPGFGAAGPSGLKSRFGALYGFDRALALARALCFLGVRGFGPLGCELFGGLSRDLQGYIRAFVEAL